MSTSATEMELMQQAVAGDVTACMSLLERFAPQVRSRLSVDAKHQARVGIDDVMQVTYLEAFLQIKRFKPLGDGAFLAWLTQIARNNLRDAVKSPGIDVERRAVAVSPDESVATFLHELGADTTTPSSSAARREMLRIIDEAVANLPRDYREVIRLHDLEGHPMREVAERVGRSTGAVHMIRARALDYLRQVLPSAGAFFSKSR